GFGGAKDHGDRYGRRLADGGEPVAGMLQTFAGIGAAEEPVFADVGDGEVVVTALNHEFEQTVRGEAAASEDRLVDRVADPIREPGGAFPDLFADVVREGDDGEAALFAGIGRLDAAATTPANDGDAAALRGRQQRRAQHEVDQLFLVAGFVGAGLAEDSAPEFGGAGERGSVGGRGFRAGARAASLVDDHWLLRGGR